MANALSNQQSEGERICLGTVVTFILQKGKEHTLESLEIQPLLLDRISDRFFFNTVLMAKINNSVRSYQDRCIFSSVHTIQNQKNKTATGERTAVEVKIAREILRGQTFPRPLTFHPSPCKMLAAFAMQCRVARVSNMKEANAERNSSNTVIC